MEEQGAREGGDVPLDKFAGSDLGLGPTGSVDGAQIAARMDEIGCDGHQDRTRRRQRWGGGAPALWRCLREAGGHEA